MPEKGENENPNPYSGENTELKVKEDAVKEATRDPADGENASNVDGEDSWIRRVGSLEREIFRLDEELKSFKQKSVIAFGVLEVSPLLHIFEENLALYLYPRGRVFGRNEIFPRLMNWINSRRGTRQGAVANNKWFQVQHAVGWNQHHDEVITRFRNPPFVPTTVEALEGWNPPPLTDVEQRCIDDLRRLSETLTQWIEDEENDRENE